jgi:hypothetical protein
MPGDSAEPNVIDDALIKEATLACLKDIEISQVGGGFAGQPHSTIERELPEHHEVVEMRFSFKSMSWLSDFQFNCDVS